jgi:D-alanyl-D-alanine dipeptidase
MKPQVVDEEVRRSYWTEQMESAAGFMDRMLEFPVEECGEAMISLPEAVAVEKDLTVEFSATLLAGRHPRLFYLRADLIGPFLAAAREMNAHGWILKAEDGFRSRAMQQAIALDEKVLDVVLRKVIWENRGRIPTPELLFRRLTCLTATRPKIGTHMSGSAIDISVLRARDRKEVGRGGPYLELSELTPMGSPFISAAAARNRAEISGLMRRHGFFPYPFEFWHYSQGDAYAEHLGASGKPARYGAVDFDPATGGVTTIPNPKDSLHSLEDIRRRMALALVRLQARGNGLGTRNHTLKSSQ